ncbi:MAG: hypothetical protein AB1758_24790, partial [Candidatus Eremiobacterota bacterium]
SQERIQAIMKNPDLTVRNLQITQYHHELSLALRDLIGPEAGTNWCAWATWASKHVGHNIRKEDLPFLRKTVETTNRVVTALIPGLSGAAAHCPIKVFMRCFQHVSAANGAIFQRTAPHFTRFVETFKGLEKPDPARFEEFLKGFEPGPPERGGEDLLVAGFSSYYQALFEKDPKRKQELLLRGNIEVVWDEQIHADRDINKAIPWYAGWAVTQSVLELNTPRETIRLGDDLTVPHGRVYPPHLETLQDPELQTLYSRHTWVPEGTTRNSAARDYRWIQDRMNLIVNVFRTRHDDDSLYHHPFGAAQVRDIYRGRCPEGPL